MKKLSITLMLTVLTVALSSCDQHFWSSLSGGTWYATSEVQGNYGVNLYPDDINYMEITFYTNGTGVVKFYDDWGRWGSYGFDWDDHGSYVTLRYYDGGYDTYYYEYHNGYLQLSRSASFYTFIEFRRTY